MKDTGELILISDVNKDDIAAIIEIENENFGPDAFKRSQFIYALKNEKAIFIKAVRCGGGLGCANKTAGYALGFIKKTGRPGAQRLSARLYSIAVATDSQGISIGKKLLTEFERGVENKNCANIYLEVKTGNTAAIKLYESYGYKKIGIISDYYHDLSSAYKFVKHYKQ